MTEEDLKKARYEHLKDLNGIACIIFTWLFAPILLGVFIRLLITHGAPVWYLCIHGLLVALSVFAIIFFIRIGMFRAIKNFLKSRKQEVNKND